MQYLPMSQVASASVPARRCAPRFSPEYIEIFETSWSSVLSIVVTLLLGAGLDGDHFAPMMSAVRALAPAATIQVSRCWNIIF